jgi:hypothetical protein
MGLISKHLYAGGGLAQASEAAPKAGSTAESKVKNGQWKTSKPERSPRKTVRHCRFSKPGLYSRMVHRLKSAAAILLESGLLTAAQLEKATQQAVAGGVPVQQAAVDLGLITEAGLLDCLSREWGVKPAAAVLLQPLGDMETARLIPEALARRHRMIAFGREGSILFVAMADPMDFFAVEDLQLRTGLEVRPFLALPGAILAALDAAFGAAGDAEKCCAAVELPKDGSADLEFDDEIRGAPEAPPSPSRAQDICSASVEGPPPSASWMMVLSSAMDISTIAKPHELDLPAPGHGGRGAPGSAAAADEVDCTVFAPPKADAGSALLVQVFAHLPIHAAQAAEAAAEFDDAAKRRGTTALGTTLARGVRLTFELAAAGLTISEAVRTLVWQGRPTSVQFDARVPADAASGAVIATVTVSQDSVPIGEIKFKLEVTSGGGGDARRGMPAGEATRYQTAFVSYASQDRAEVLRRVQMLAPAGIKFFQDVMDLVPGQRWSDELYKRIDESDVLFLFWSSAAKSSEWVEREWRYALEKRGTGFIKPVILEGPPIPPPPAELADIHFNDKILYFLKA